MQFKVGDRIINNNSHNPRTGGLRGTVSDKTDKAIYIDYDNGRRGEGLNRGQGDCAILERAVQSAGPGLLTRRPNPMTTSPLPKQIELHRDRMWRRDEDLRVEKRC